MNIKGKDYNFFYEMLHVSTCVDVISDVPINQNWHRVTGQPGELGQFLNSK